jgi:hypothetical protein
MLNNFLIGFDVGVDKFHFLVVLVLTQSSGDLNRQSRGRGINLLCICLVVCHALDILFQNSGWRFLLRYLSCLIILNIHMFIFFLWIGLRVVNLFYPSFVPQDLDCIA